MTTDCTTLKYVQDANSLKGRMQKQQEMFGERKIICGGKEKEEEQGERLGKDEQSNMPKAQTTKVSKTEKGTEERI